MVKDLNARNQQVRLSESQYGILETLKRKTGKTVSALLRGFIPARDIMDAVEVSIRLKGGGNTSRLDQAMAEMPERYMACYMRNHEAKPIKYQLRLEVLGLRDHGYSTPEYRKAVAAMYVGFLNAERGVEGYIFYSFDYQGKACCVLGQPGDTDRDLKIIELQIKNMIDDESNAENDTE